MDRDALIEKHTALKMKLAALEIMVEAEEIKFEAFNLILRLTQGEGGTVAVKAGPVAESTSIQSRETTAPKRRGRKKGSTNAAKSEVKRRQSKQVTKELKVIDAERQKQLDAVLSHLSEHKQATLTAIHQGVGGRKSTVLNSIAQLKKEKQIVFKSTPKPGFYSLAKE